ncbi:MAG: Clp protease ClpP [Methylococcaceae bacterium]|nr:Clp protease ClpP [Methylococcaceae bacterium]
MAKGKFWTIRAAKEDPKVGELLLYGLISNSSWWGDEVTPKQFHEDLQALGDIDTLNIYINSDGGDVFAAKAIYSMLKRHTAQKVVYVDGLAASAAADVAMVGDRIIMPKNAMMMIHRGWTIALGNKNDFQKIAEELALIDQTRIAVYQEKTGLAEKEIVALLDAETWLTADDALEKGFATEIEEAKEIAACLVNGKAMINGLEMDLSRYKHPPALAEKPQAVDPPQEPPQSPPEPQAKAEEADLDGSVFDSLKLQNQVEGGFTR